MGRVFLRKEFSGYLGENRSILDINASFIPNTPTPTPSPTQSPFPVCPSEIYITNTLGGTYSGATGTYTRQTVYTGGTFNGGWFDSSNVFHPGAFSGDGLTYAVYGRQSGGFYYQVIWGFGPGVFFYRNQPSTGDYLWNGGTNVSGAGMDASPDPLPSSGGIYYPRAGSYLGGVIYARYPSSCPTPTPSVTRTNTPTPSVTQTQTPSVTPTMTPTPSSTPGTINFCIGNGFDDYTYSVVGDGSNILVGGVFNYYKNFFSPGVVKLDRITGNVDTGFTSPYGISTIIYVAKPSSYYSGKTYVGGNTVSGTFSPPFQRLNSDGSVDTTFSGITTMTGAVNDFVELSDGSLILIGSFTSINGTNRARIAKLNSNGSLNTTFQVGTGLNSPSVFDIELSLDESNVFVGGNFTSYSGISTTRLVKINSTTGVLNTTFAPATFSDQVRGLTFDGSGNLWAVGNFSAYPGSSGGSNFICALETISGTTIPTADFGDGFEDSGFGIEYDAVNDKMVVITQSIPATENTNQYQNITFYGRIMSVLPNGDFDNTFGSTGTTTYGFSKEIPGFQVYDNDIFIDTSGDIFVTGTFTTFSQNRYDRLIKLDDTGQSITRTNC